MAKKNLRGKFITFEGSEGCGKSTQSGLLYGYLKRRGHKVVYLREPGATRISEKIRKILLDAKNDAITPKCEMLLYMAARAQIVQEVIKPALRGGYIVICDRFLDSTIAYQGYGLGMDMAVIRHIGNFVTEGIRPDLTIFLDLAVEKGFRHRSLSRDRIERRSFQYHLRVRRGYLELARSEPARIKIIKVENEKKKTQQAIRALVDRILEKGR